MAVVLKKDKKFEYVYIKDVPVVYASVHDPKDMHTPPKETDKNQSKREYSVTAFVTTEDRKVLEDEVLINKQLMEVGVDKNKKRKIKYPLKVEKDGEEQDTAYTPYEGLHGISLTLKEFTSAGKPANLIIIDKEGKPFTEMVGNGSRVTIKLFGYRNQEDLLNVSMQVVQVLEHVPYEGGGNGVIEDEELGVSYDLSDGKKSSHASDPEMDGDVPFDVGDTDNADY